MIFHLVTADYLGSFGVVAVEMDRHHVVWVVNKISIFAFDMD